MKKILFLFIVLICLPAAAAGSAFISGAGATFPFPLYSKWAYFYAKKSGTRLNYQSIGSGGGIRQIRANTVDFGASDAPLTAEELTEWGLLQFPMAIGGVVPVVNIEGVKPGELRLTGRVLVLIYRGKIRNWDDPEIKELNPKLNISGKITVVHRSDDSGTTWIFTNYLSKVSRAWKADIGFGKAVKWPVGVGGKGNDGVAKYVKSTKNSIGYVEYAYTLENNLMYVRLRNRAGTFVAPSIYTFRAAAAGADWKGTPGYSVVLTHQRGDHAWPISGATFILVPREPSDCAKTGKVLAFFDWAYKHGARIAAGLDYVPIPSEVYRLMEESWKKEIICKGKPARVE